MDPDANLRRQLAIARAALHVEGADATLVELSELVLDLDDWISGAGFVPCHWIAARTTR